MYSSWGRNIKGVTKTKGQEETGKTKDKTGRKKSWKGNFLVNFLGSSELFRPVRIVNKKKEENFFGVFSEMNGVLATWFCSL